MLGCMATQSVAAQATIPQHKGDIFVEMKICVYRDTTTSLFGSDNVDKTVCPVGLE
jgi:hypothetical protein